MEKILIEIKGTQQYGRDTDVTELTTFGTIRDDGTAYIIKYKEEIEEPQESVRVTVRVNKDESAVQMTRTGSSHSSLLIEKSKRHLCNYGTEFGDLLMGVYGRDIEADIENGRFHFEYDIDFNGAVASQNTVRMNISKRYKTKKV
ncbi:MAG TPA: DUF1934 domain-containing protein [Candidatus Eubacterium faecipullorum]|uniref:DUF1934 domain-containing protein n=1 Tax=Candidatus Eubacterium faecipullorum TaxID=2838571 RepID=A0A9D1UFU5_9FIRM|nr:DUF1934 domain-containing protein [Candidatus Eubacterium faecipullorum]